MKQSRLGRTLELLYRLDRRFVRRVIRKIAQLLEGGELTSVTLRRIFRKYHQLEIGDYSHGGCFVPYQFDRQTTVGRYCSIARTARAMNRNHPMNYKSMHAYFFNPRFGLCNEDRVGYTPLSIGDDVWIGHNAIIMPQVRTVGTGAVLAAGAVVNKDVPPYAVVVGNPARVVRFRFSEGVIRQLIDSRWWEKTPRELSGELADFVRAHSSEDGREPDAEP